MKVKNKFDILEDLITNWQYKIYSDGKTNENINTILPNEEQENIYE